MSLSADDRSQAGSTREFLERVRARTPLVSRYRHDGEIARGGMGAILRVWDEDLRRHLAMKVVLGGRGSTVGDAGSADARVLTRFLEEAQVTGQLEHPGIVPVHELGVDADGRVYFTMKLVQGETLEQVFEALVQGRGGWTRARVLGLLLRVCEALSYAHAKGVIHRDLKPGNVMVGRHGEVYVMDWGLAKVLTRAEGVLAHPESAHGAHADAVHAEHADAERSELAGLDADLADGSSAMTLDGDVVGTPAYMPPEQAAGRLAELGPRSDVYAVGAMLYHLIAGHMPHTRPGEATNPIAVWRAAIAGPPTPLAQAAPDAHPDLVAICERAMARDPSARHQTMDELLEDLRGYLERGVTGARRSLAGWVAKVGWTLKALGWFEPLSWMVLTVMFVLAAFNPSSTFRFALPFEVGLPASAATLADPPAWIRGVALTSPQGMLQVTFAGRFPVFVGLLLAALALEAFWHAQRRLRAVFTTLEEGRPFVAENVRRLRRVAALLLGFAILKTALSAWLVHSIGGAITVEGRSVPVDFPWSFVLLGSAVLVWIVAQVFQLGVELEERPSEARA